MSTAAQTVNLKPSCSVFCIFHEGWGNNDVIDVIKGLGYALKYEHKDVQSEPTNIITSQILAVPKDFYILHCLSVCPLPLPTVGNGNCRQACEACFEPDNALLAFAALKPFSTGAAPDIIGAALSSAGGASGSTGTAAGFAGAGIGSTEALPCSTGATSILHWVPSKGRSPVPNRLFF